MNKKSIIIIAVTLVIVAVVVTGTILIVNSINSSNANKTPVVPAQESADALRVQAEEARKNDDAAKAKALLLEAQQQYQEVPKTDVTTNAQEDIKAQLFLLEQTNKTQ